jgi:hypothetical protein
MGGMDGSLIIHVASYKAAFDADYVMAANNVMAQNFSK